MLPLHDENPTHSKPVVTLALIGTNALVFVLQLTVGISLSTVLFGLIPAHLMNQPPPPAVLEQLRITPRALSVNFEPAWVTLFTSMFLHGGWMHILGNMWFLWLFGNNVEDRMGKPKFLLFYLLCGLGAAAAQIATGPNSPIPMVGASGAIAGVLGGYLVLFPGSRVTCVTLIFILTTVTLPAWIVLGLWFVIEFARGLMSAGGTGGGVAYAAHVGGFLCGLALVRLFAHPAPPPPRERLFEPRPDSFNWR
jgi:membrane associated rhomboid family serine protease